MIIKLFIFLFLAFLPSISMGANSSGGSLDNNVDSNGNIGIGTSVPTSHVYIRGASTTQLGIMNTTAQSASQGAAFNCDMNDGTQTVAGSRVCTFQPRAADNTGTLQSIGSIDFFANGSITSANANGYMRFRTVPSGSATLTERMRITDAGNVGIGTTIPSDLLQVLGGSVRAAGYKSSDGTAGVTGATCTAWKNGLCTSL